MDQQEWEKINEIVDTALELEAEKRATFIQKECTDRELRYQVTELLNAIEQSGTKDFLEGSDGLLNYLNEDISDENAYTSSLIGETIGKYAITDLLGYGGMGSVFLAERADGAYNQKIALKIMRRGMDTPANTARFKRERNILARLNHPNIARLLDGGVTAEGLPYFAMEYVQGTPLIKYCDNNQLSVDERLTLFKNVCTAVQHAHRNAIIHRDLKPSNIFVTDEGTVKVLDFGIAKLIETNTSDASSFQTRTDARILTFGYAAPEQFENKAITTATDSYTLGILLYKLLAGIHPYDITGKSFTDTEKFIRNQTPARPSAQFSKLAESEKAEIAKQRNTSPSDLSQKLKGDLDAIVMKSLRKEPEARYRSVEQMLEDLNRYKQSLPLIAQSDTLRYRFGKFIRRNSRAVVSIFLILTAIIGFGSYHINRITAERSIARAEAEKAATVKDFLIDIFSSSNPQSASFEGKDISAQQLLVNGKDRIGQNLQNQPDVYTEVLTAIGDALKGVDAFEEAEKSYKKALAKSSETTHPLENRIRIYVKLGNLNALWSKDQKAPQPAREAQEVLKKIENPPSALEASVFSLLGRVNVLTENYEQANSYYEKADSIYVSAGMESSFDYIQMLNGYGKSSIYISNYKKAEEVLLQSNELHRKNFSNPTMTVAKNYEYIGWANRDLGNFKKSNDYFLKSIDLNRRLTGEESIPTAASMYHLSINYILSADFKKAEKLAKEVLKIYQKHLQPTNDYVQRPKKYIAIAKYNQNQFSEAKNILQEIIKIRTKRKGEDSMGTVGPSAHLAVVYQKTGDFEKAISLLEKCIRIYKEELGEYNRRVGRAIVKLAAVYREMGKYKLAGKYFQQVESIYQNVLPENNHQNADFYFEYGKLKQDTDNHQKAREYFNRAYNIYLDIFGPDSKRTKEAKSFLEGMSHV